MNSRIQGRSSPLRRMNYGQGIGGQNRRQCERRCGRCSESKTSAMPFLGHKEGAFWFYLGLMVLGIVTVITYRKDPPGVITGWAAFAVGSGLLLFPPVYQIIRDRLRLSQPSPIHPKILSITAYTDHLSHLYDSSHELLTSVFAKRQFALLTVRNVSTRDLSQVVARCRFEEGIEDYCTWALETGSPPFKPGTHEADLSAGNSR